MLVLCELILFFFQTDLMGQSVFNIIAPEDHDRLKLHLGSEELLGPEWRKYFNVHLKRAGPRSEAAVYELVSFMGMQRNSKEKLQLQNGASSKEATTSVSGNDVSWPEALKHYDCSKDLNFRSSYSSLSSLGPSP